MIEWIISLFKKKERVTLTYVIIGFSPICEYTGRHNPLREYLFDLQSITKGYISNTEVTVSEYHQVVVM